MRKVCLRGTGSADAGDSAAAESKIRAAALIKPLASPYNT